MNAPTPMPEPTPSRSPRASPWLVLAAPALAALTLALAACEGCKSPKVTTPPPPVASADPVELPDPGPPTVRLYIVTDMAGALEPCGCTKDQLGGIGHFAALVEKEKARAPASAVVAAGPLFFMDPDLKPDHVDQDVEKAKAIARAMKLVGIAAFAPSTNDWAAGSARLAELETASGGAALLANIAPGSDWKGSVIRDIGGVKVGFFGLGVPAPAEGGDGGAWPPTATMKTENAAKSAVAALKKEGANVVIALASIGRGEAKRVADAVHDLTAIVVGEPKMAGEGNTPAPPAERIDKVIVSQTGNHLQSVAVLDLFVRDGSYEFADASGIEQAQRLKDLSDRIEKLHVKISNWERDGRIPKADLDARRGDLERLEKEYAAAGVRPPPASGSFFRYAVKEIREKLGKDPAIDEVLLSYYKTVNDHNREAFRDRLPRTHTGEQAAYIGVNACTTCHKEARKFWETTKHAHAYETLQKQFKEFNLDCVGCHVTGYEQPGGSTVTHSLDYLKDVQCETCHGPGSKHPPDPKNPAFMIRKPKPEGCLNCHFPPHVEQFDARAKMDEILGVGHGRR